MRVKKGNNQDTNQFSTFSELHKSELEEVTDDAVNAAYNFFDAERMKYYHNVFVKTDRNFRRNKVRKPVDWENYASVIRLCRKNSFHLRCYIKYCFINRLVPKAKGKTLSDISYLRNYPQVIEYAKNKNQIEKLYAIYMSIMKTVMLVKKISKAQNIDIRNAIRSIISSGKLSEYIETAVVSPYFLSLIHNIVVLIESKYNKYDDDNTVINDLCKRMTVYGSDAMKSISMFYPTATSKTIVQICEM